MLTVKNEEGDPLPFVQIGHYMDWSYPNLPTYVLGNTNAIPPSSDDNGKLTLEQRDVFPRGEESDTTRLFLHDPINGLAGSIVLNKNEFSGETEITLKPATHVNGRVSMEGGDLSWASLGILQGENLVGVAGVTEDNTFTLQLPDGEYFIRAYGGTEDGPQQQVMEPITIDSDAPVSMMLTLTNDPTPEPESRPSDFLATQKGLVGSDAPELQNIRGWKNTDPLTMAGLKGKPVLLDFWGYWCGPCVYSMPRLMAIHDAFAEHGLVVIGIHEASSLESIDELPALVKNSVDSVWGGREIPFPIALDGGTSPSGDTTQAYEVVGFPTTYFIDREGKVHSTFHPSSPEAWQEVCKLVGVEIDEPTVKAAPAKPSANAEPMDEGPQWKQAIGVLYRLDQGWPVRYVYPPFISSRKDMLREQYPELDLESNDAPNMLIIRHEDYDEDEYPIAAYGYLPEFPLRTVMDLVLGVEPWAIDGDEGLLDIDMMGDWIVDHGYEEEPLVELFTDYAGEMLGLDIEITKEPTEKQILEVTIVGAATESQRKQLARRLYHAASVPAFVTSETDGESTSPVPLSPRGATSIEDYVKELNESGRVRAEVTNKTIDIWIIRQP